MNERVIIPRKLEKDCPKHCACGPCSPEVGADIFPMEKDKAPTAAQSHTATAVLVLGIGGALWWMQRGVR